MGFRTSPDDYKLDWSWIVIGAFGLIGGCAWFMAARLFLDPDSLPRRSFEGLSPDRLRAEAIGQAWRYLGGGTLFIAVAVALWFVWRRDSEDIG